MSFIRFVKLSVNNNTLVTSLFHIKKITKSTLLNRKKNVLLKWKMVNCTINGIDFVIINIKNTVK